MKTITQKIYLYQTPNSGGDASYTVTTTPDMEVAGWVLVDAKEVDFEFDEAIAKQKKIDAVMAKQEAVAAELLELTS